jgi:2-amino-4-hydroxy-6-hydroxymethyldihydropteridine diphosphokinase
MWKLRSVAIARTPEHIYIGFGSNLGSSAEILAEVLDDLTIEGYDVLRISELYQSEPWGGAEGADYLNCVLEIAVKGSPEEMLRKLQEIETRHGRTRDYHYAPRTCDLDILLWSDERLNTPDLVIPHPMMEERRFVLRPLCDLIPDAMHPVSKNTFRSLLATLRDNLEVKPLRSQTEASLL